MYIHVCVGTHACALSRIYIYILSIFQFSAQVETHFENADTDVLMHEHLTSRINLKNVYIHKCLKHSALYRSFSLSYDCSRIIVL